MLVLIVSCMVVDMYVCVGVDVMQLGWWYGVSPLKHLKVVLLLVVVVWREVGCFHPWKCDEIGFIVCVIVCSRLFCAVLNVW